MRSKARKAFWVRELVKTKNFVILTDTQAVISLKGTNPKEFDDLLMLTAQMAELQGFQKSLDKLIKDHAKIARKLLNRGSKEKLNVSKSKKKVRKIEVKEG